MSQFSYALNVHNTNKPDIILVQILLSISNIFKKQIT